MLSKWNRIIKFWILCCWITGIRVDDACNGDIDIDVDATCVNDIGVVFQFVDL